MIEGIYSLSNEKSIPIGCICSFHGGHHSDSINSDFSMAMANGNSVSDINNFLKNYKVCDGTAPNDPGSPIFNASNKYLPNITDERFLSGKTAIGIGGANSWSPDIMNPYAGSHSHSYGSYYARVTASANANVYTTRVSSSGWTSNRGIDYGDKTVETLGSVAYVLGNTAAGTPSYNAGNVENRPPYLDCFYVMRIK